MRTFAHKPKGADQSSSAEFTEAGRAYCGGIREVNSIRHWQRTMGNQAVMRLLGARTGNGERDLGTDGTAHFGDDSQRAPAHPATPKPVQRKIDDADDRGALHHRAPQATDDLAGDTFGFGRLRIIPIRARNSPTMPTATGAEQDIFQPPGIGSGSAATIGPSGGGAQVVSDSCDQPRSMNKIVSGSFLGGLKMDDYFPDLSGTGLWDHADTGGPFDTGTQAGGNAQLFGVIPSPCKPSRFRLQQTAHPVRFRVGGVKQPLEGKMFDDLARSGRDFSGPPSRREFLGGGDAPLGFIISMADPPSVNYSPARPEVERDTDFVSSLVGPGGRQSVKWSQSVRVSKGAITVNTLT